MAVVVARREVLWPAAQPARTGALERALCTCGVSRSSAGRAVAATARGVPIGLGCASVRQVLVALVDEVTFG